VNERRQRTAPSLITAVGILALLGAGSGCEARSSAEAALTAVSLAQTALPGVQTALPGVQATAQAGATAVIGVLNDPQAINAQLQLLLVGASIEVATTPPGASNETVTDVTVKATDGRGSFAQLDGRARQAAVAAAMLAVAQYYPNAAVSLTLMDGSGSVLQTGSKGVGQAPAIQ
jgi:hypothetical protein